MSHSRVESQGTSSVSTTAKILSSSLAGFSELCLFHPFDTSIKRLQNHNGQVISRSLSYRENLQRLLQITSNNTYKFGSYFRGLPSGIIYKVSQRTYKYTVQDLLAVEFKKNNTFSSHRIVADACAGALTGAGEAVLLPLDAIKILNQTKSASVKSRNVFSLLYSENWKLYRGFCITATRNTIGSFALFGGNQFTREYILKLEDGKKATLFQHFFTSIGGAIPSLVFSSPFDVVKTRINANKGEKQIDGKTVRVSARSVFKETLRNEGVGAFTKGLGTKLLTIGPKLTFSLGTANFFKERVDALLDEHSSPKFKNR